MLPLAGKKGLRAGWIIPRLAFWTPSIERGCRTLLLLQVTWRTGRLLRIIIEKDPRITIALDFSLHSLLSVTV